MATYPRIFLAIDNCFASKRWTSPDEWMRVIKDLGLKYIEASADTECDPLYMGQEYLADWIRQVKQAENDLGMKVVNLYSGHGTYTTLGLAHPDERIRERIKNEWIKPMIHSAGLLNAGLGFFCHAFNNEALQDADEYYKSLETLYSDFADISKYAAEKMNATIGVEQMYSPHQVPWTIQGAQILLKEVYGRAGKPFYLTIDLGHTSAQRRFRKPGIKKLKARLKNGNKKVADKVIWLGPEKAFEAFEKIKNESKELIRNEITEILALMDEYHYLFAQKEDADPYTWLERLSLYSPIIHLQQTDGKSSSHHPFTSKFNRSGIIRGGKILRSIKEAYDSPELPGMPPPVEKIYLTLEIFSSTADINQDIISQLKDSVSYWRRFIPSDGEPIDKIIKRL